MSFGKRTGMRSPDVEVKKSAFWPTRTKLFGLLVLFVVGIGTAAYIERREIAATFYPAALSSMTLPDQQLVGSWREDSTDGDAAASTINWMVMQMAALCGDQPTVLQYQSGEEFERLTNLDAPDRSIQRGLYGDGEGTARDAIDKLKANKESFCANEYHVAVFDSRVAAVHYLRQSIEASKERLSETTRLAALLQSASRKQNQNLTREEQIVVECARAYPEDADEVQSCFRQINEVRGPKSDAQRAKDVLDAAVGESRESRAVSSTSTDSYTSPDIDIRDSCRQVHPDNYEYRDICERQQEEARSELRSMYVPDEIARYCDRVHQTSYVYRKICYQNQLAAKERRRY